MIKIKYQNIYDAFIEHYKKVHVNPWHEISEEQLESLYKDLVNSMDINDYYTFKYFMDYIIKRLSGMSDAHTKYEQTFPIPMNFRIFRSEILVNFPIDLKNSKLIAINGICIDTIIRELEEIITYGTLGKRRYEIEKALFNKFILFGIPSLRGADELIFDLEKADGTRITRKFLKKEQYCEELFDINEYYYGKIAAYNFIDNCLIFYHSSLQNKFKEKIELVISNLRKEDMTNIDTIIIDIRGNTGGNSALNKMLMDFLQEHRDKKLICLTDYRVFSGGRYALRDLIQLGATTIGEEIGTPTNCYGNSNHINIEGHSFSVSECYFHPFLGWSASSKKEFNEEVTASLLIPHIFKPDILIEERKEDYILGIDTILNYALNYSKNKTLRK